VRKAADSRSFDLDFRDSGFCEAERKTKHQRGEAVSSHGEKTGIGAQNRVKTLLVLQKTRRCTLKTTCKSMKQDENKKHYKKSSTLVWARNQMGNTVFRCFSALLLSALIQFSPSRARFAGLSC
jgi:hypothetical protein